MHGHRLRTRDNPVAVDRDRAYRDALQTNRPPGHAVIVRAKYTGAVGACVDPSTDACKTTHIAAPNLARTAGFHCGDPNPRRYQKPHRRTLRHCFHRTGSAARTSSDISEHSCGGCKSH